MLRSSLGSKNLLLVSDLVSGISSWISIDISSLELSTNSLSMVSGSNISLFWFKSFVLNKLFIKSIDFLGVMFNLITKKLNPEKDSKRTIPIFPI